MISKHKTGDWECRETETSYIKESDLGGRRRKGTNSWIKSTGNEVCWKGQRKGRRGPHDIPGGGCLWKVK